MMIERTIKMKLKKLFRALALCTAGVLACAILTACGDKGDSSSQTSAADTDKKFVITLYANDAPITCENFEKLVKEKFYDGLTFHRVVDGFMHRAVTLMVTAQAEARKLSRASSQQMALKTA